MSPSRGPWRASNNDQADYRGNGRANEPYHLDYAEGYRYNSGGNQQYPPGSSYNYGYENSSAYPASGYAPRYDYGHGYTYEQRSEQPPVEYRGYSAYSSYSQYGREENAMYYDGDRYNAGNYAPSQQSRQWDDDRRDHRDAPPARQARRGSPVYDDYRSSEDIAPMNGNRSYSTYRGQPKSQQHQDRYRDQQQESKPEDRVSGSDKSKRHYTSSQTVPSSSQSRARSSSPPRPATPPPPRRTTPIEEYLEVAEKPSWTIQDASSARKLIVLDLNGSLLVRSAHQRRPYQPQSQSSNQGRQLNVRTVHPRPYLSSFVQYILHPENKKWLDTMVWSSAQPHSVDDMVAHCFSERKSELKAVWARDTLGLTGDEYHKKTQTYKDLAKPWAELPLFKSAAPTRRSKSPSSPSRRPLSPTLNASTSASSSSQRHSALTTLLIDDSPVKAALQPYNHLCIPEYVQAMRNHDLKVADAEWEKLHPEDEEEAPAAETGKSSKREEKKAKRREARLAGKMQNAAEAMQDGPGGSTSAVDEAEEEETEIVPPPPPTASRNGYDPNATNIEDLYDPDPDVKRIIREVVMIEGQLVNREEIIKRVTREVVMIDGKMVNPDDEPPRIIEREVAVPASAFASQEYVPPNEFTSAALAWAAKSEPVGNKRQTASHRRRRVRRAEKKEREKKEREEKEQKEREALEGGGGGPAGSAVVPREMESEANQRPVVPQGEPEEGELVEEELEENAPAQDRELSVDKSPSKPEAQVDHNAVTSSAPSDSSELQYDQTLLAVIGILDHIKYEGNVAGWMKSGGLISTAQNGGVASRDKVVDDGNRVLQVGPANHSDQKKDANPIKEEVVAAELSDRTKQMRSRTPPTPSRNPGEVHSSPKRRRLESDADKFMDVAPEKDAQNASAAQTKMWFERPEVLTFWAERGKEALAKLGLEVIVGI
ncbi:hypothetical protein D9613_009089 [Agrocybe pediades]|uniref:FCP1 homology domain-containing protein n=1 Tax=Agrocybe pediades TaxID=84607 RepID=A0A8H4VTZ3_9AGAR|nr:hypothetical protein D9613_009089 [Agrocybe pediades]